MNKAFVREPDDTGAAHCPKCGSLGSEVTRATMAEHLTGDGAAQLAESAFFCPFPRCEVVYFDRFDRTATTAALKHPVWPKDPSAPLCGCFGLTAEDIEADLREGTPPPRARAAGQEQVRSGPLSGPVGQRPMLRG